MPITTKIVLPNNFIPRPALAGLRVTLSPTSTPPAHVQVNPSGAHGGTLNNVLTTAARHSELVTNLNSGNTVIVVVTTDSAGKVTDFTSSQQVGTAKVSFASSELISADHGDSGASSDSAIPL